MISKQFEKRKKRNFPEKPKQIPKKMIIHVVSKIEKV